MTRTRHAARSHSAAASPRVNRRVSGPAAPPRTGTADPHRVPRHTAGARPVPVSPIRGRTGEFARIAITGLVDRFLRGRGWIWFVAIALGGIVFMQVWLLKLNTGISRAVQTTDTLERENASLDASISRLSDADRIKRVAGGRGMVLPEAGQVGYVTVRGDYDVTKALVRMRPPSADARELLALAKAGDLAAVQAAAGADVPATSDQAAATAPVVTGTDATTTPTSTTAAAPTTTTTTTTPVAPAPTTTTTATTEAPPTTTATATEAAPTSTTAATTAPATTTTTATSAPVAPAASTTSATGGVAATAATATAAGQ